MSKVSPAEVGSVGEPNIGTYFILVKDRVHWFFNVYVIFMFCYIIIMFFRHFNCGNISSQPNRFNHFKI